MLFELLLMAKFKQLVLLDKVFRTKALLKGFDVPVNNKLLVLGAFDLISQVGNIGLDSLILPEAQNLIYLSVE